MTLAFSQQIGGKPTNFVEKIWFGLIQFNQILDRKDMEFHLKKCGEKELLWSEIDKITPKLHTIREDKGNRWKEGMLMHMVIGNRTPNRFQFAPLVEVTRIQVIDIDNLFLEKKLVSIDGRALEEDEIRILALNDGFDHLDDFWDFFKGSLFSGKLIHWTKLKY